MNWDDSTPNESNLLDFQENIDALRQYWQGQLKSAKHWVENDEGWIRCHPEEDITSRKGYIRNMREEKKRREGSIEHSKRRILYCESMLREINHEVDLENERILPTD